MIPFHHYQFCAFLRSPLHRLIPTGSFSRGFSKLTGTNASPYLISMEEVLKRYTGLGSELDEVAGPKGIKLIDTTWLMGQSGYISHLIHQTKHYKGALYYPMGEVIDDTKPYPYMLPSEEAFADFVGGQMGIGSQEGEEDIVLYDAAGVMTSPRVYWTFNVFGHENVRLMQGNMGDWMERAGPIECGPANEHVKEEKEYIPKKRPEIVKTYEQVLAHVQCHASGGVNTAQFVDTRPKEVYDEGHIPGAISLPFPKLLNQERSAYKVREDLELLFSSMNIQPQKDIICYCGSGITACIVYLGLKMTYPEANISVYDGSWSEYSAITQSPIEKS